MLTTEEREYIFESMQNLLEEYDYNYTDDALDQIINEWSYKKAELIEGFKRHPNYVEGKFMIAFTQNYEREIDIGKVQSFSIYLDSVIAKYVDTLPEDINSQRCAEGRPWLPDDLYAVLTRDFGTLMIARTISEDTAKVLDKIIPQIHPHAGQKTSRVVNKICQYLGYDKHPDYNREFAKFADALSPMSIKRHTILSINPLDYLTMSFGNSWASCHTIDKQNKRGMPNNYSGCYSSGTISYMLDPSSMVFYTVDAEYDGNEYWTQPKINRQMFHYGEDKLVQARLYPQDNDGDSDAYAPYRNIVQSIISFIFDFPNLWLMSKGVEAASKYIRSCGTHYRDYEHFNSCTLSLKKGSDNENSFIVGASPICIDCGEEHNVAESINHCQHGRVCESCGAIITNEEDEYWVGDYCYCRDCVYYCDHCGEWVHESNITRVANGDYVCEDCLDEYYRYCEQCGSYHHENNITWVDSAQEYICNTCIDDYYTWCNECNEYYHNDDVIEGPDGEWYCKDCYEELFADEEEEEEE